MDNTHIVWLNLRDRSCAIRKRKTASPQIDCWNLPNSKVNGVTATT